MPKIMQEYKKDDDRQSDNSNSFDSSSEKNRNPNQVQFPQFGNVNIENKGGRINFDPSVSKKIEAAKSNGWGAQFSSFVLAHKKTIVIGIVGAILFLGGSLISRNSGDKSEDEVSESSAITNDTRDESEGNLVKPIEIKLDEDGQIVIDQVGPMPEKDDAQQKISNSKKQFEIGGDSITVTAKSGDGITHLARTAINQYLDDTRKTLTPQQKK